MMFQTRNEVRQVYSAVWHKMRRKDLLEPLEALIAGVIEGHPEYHSLLERGAEAEGEEFTPERGQTNPYLHMGMHITLREQAAADRPPGFRSVYQRLVAAQGQHEAEHAMMECLGASLWQAQRDNAMPDEAAYLECLKNL